MNNDKTNGKKISVIGICGESVFLEVDHFNEVGETVISYKKYIEAGGKGVNQAVALARLGANVNYMTYFGDDEGGRYCTEFIKGEGINTVVRMKNVPSDYGVIITDKTGENRVTVYSGASALANKDDVLAFEDCIKESEFLLLQLESNLECLIAAVDIAYKHGVKVILNPAPPKEIPLDTLEKIWLFTPNESESKSLFKNFTPERAVVTLGGKGAMVIENGKETFIPSKKIKVVNTTGAGDTFNGALAYKLLCGESLVDSTRFAVLASAYKVAHPYVMAGIPNKYQLEDFEKELEK